MQLTHGFWAERFEICRKVMVPHMWNLLRNPDNSHAYKNFLIAAGYETGAHQGPKWHDGDFYKWLEATAHIYSVTRDESLDRLMEAARIDGAGEIGLLWRIAIPLALPGLGTIAILNVLFTWNDIIWPLVSIFDRNAMPIAAGLLAFRSDLRTEYEPLFAGYTLASIPLIIIFAFTIRRFIRGLEGGLSL